MSVDTSLSGEVDRRIGRVLKMLCQAHGTPLRDVADLLGVTPTALSARIAGRRRFQAEEVDLLARHFEIDPGVFFVDPATLVSALRHRADDRTGSASTRWYPRTADRKAA
jgi:transcriptional regulator with XRE-family HTH domain